MALEASRDESGKAIAYLLLGVTGGLGLDLCAKEILRSYSLEQFVFLRSLIGVLIFLLLARQFGGIDNLKTNRWLWHLLRTVLAVGAMFGFFYGISRMPLVERPHLGLYRTAYRDCFVCANAWRSMLAGGVGQRSVSALSAC